MASDISILNFDNRPFMRSLTARAIGVGGSDIIRWTFPEYATAQTTAFNTYTNNSAGPVNQIGTLIFSFSSTTYDFRTTAYTLCTMPLSCFSTAATATTGIVFDTFPDIDLTLYINYERTNSSSYFYRLTSTQPLTASPSLAPQFLRLESTTYDLVSSLSASYYNAWFSTNRSTTRLTNTLSITGFDRTSTTRVSSIQATLTASSAPGSLSAFWSPHILERSLSAVFVPYFLSGDFIGYPRGYFVSSKTYDILTPSTFNNSPGMYFIGEGHTETIILSSTVDPRTATNIWRLSGSTTRYPVSANNLSQPLLTAFVTLTSLTGTDIRIPVSLHLTNSLFLSTDPFYFYNDVTGEITPYPYYISTTDFNGNEIVPRNKLKESIQIIPYEPIRFEFNPGISPTIYLPRNGSPNNYTAILKNNIQATDSLDPCFGRYGLIWNWAAYTGCSANPSSFTGKPSSWLTVMCSGTFPKQWTLTDVGSAERFDSRIPSYSAIDMTWTLSTGNWFILTTAIPLSTNTYDYSLQYLNLGTTPFTVSVFNETPINIGAKQSIQTQVSAQFTIAAQNLGYFNDWQPKITTFNETFTATVGLPPEARIYTPNKFVLTGTDVNFQNILTNIGSLSTVIIDLDDGKTVQLTGSNVTNNFTASYDVVGFKTIKIYMYTIIESNPIIVTFPNIIQVLSEYDQVSPTEYRSTDTLLELPWNTSPYIGSNDWAIADNINTWFKKFFDNFNYLESRGRIYSGTYSDYFGYLGVPPTNSDGLTACPVWTWEDLDCFNTSLPYFVTWRSVLSAEDPLDENGEFVNQGCGTWETYFCRNQQINPTCYGLYDVEWSWRARKKANSILPITWKQTKSINQYAKKWVYEPSDNQPITVCDQGLWQVNIPGINEFYNPIANPSVQSRCAYTGITSRNNILYLAQKKQIRLLRADRAATFFDYEDTYDGGVSFYSDIKNVCLDSTGKIYTLDGIVNQVSVYTYEEGTPGDNFKLFTNWGGFGTAASTTKFSNPNDIHIDQLDNVWICDTGNSCVKHYSNTGTWLKTVTDENLKQTPPLSLAVDSQKNVHILTDKDIRVYSYEGEFLYSYNYIDYTSLLFTYIVDVYTVSGEYLYTYSFQELQNAKPRKINASYNREVIYLALDYQVIKFFRNGVFYGYIIDARNDVQDITSVYQDEYRNVLITMQDKILKYPDVMSLERVKGQLPDTFWKLEDILIHKEEYIQNWVYTRAFQRMWDNIEIFRNTLHFNGTTCKGYKGPIYGKEKMVVGQNEIVTSTVINRILGYLWENLNTMLDYFDPSCDETLTP